MPAKRALWEPTVSTRNGITEEKLHQNRVQIKNKSQLWRSLKSSWNRFGETVCQCLLYKTLLPWKLMTSLTLLYIQNSGEGDDCQSESQAMAKRDKKLIRLSHRTAFDASAQPWKWRHVANGGQRDSQRQSEDIVVSVSESIANILPLITGLCRNATSGTVQRIIFTSLFYSHPIHTSLV